jgi:hypothetical protein
MKNICALFLFAGLIMNQSYANNIQSFSVIPLNPTTGDSVKVIIECVFTSGGCDGSANLIGIAGNQIYADALHCLGMLTVICTDYDTIVLPPMAAGNYTFNFSLSSGQGIPCTPGIVTDDVDSVSFTVTDATGISILSKDNYFQVIPNPSTGKFTIKHNTIENSLVKIYSLEGTLIKSMQLNNQETEIESYLPSGVYLIVSEEKERRLFRKLTILN